MVDQTDSVTKVALWQWEFGQSTEFSGFGGFGPVGDLGPGVIMVLGVFWCLWVIFDPELVLGQELVFDE